MPRHFLGSVLLCGAALFAAGCCGAGGRAQEAACSAFFPEGQVPRGWRIVPSSKMPSSDKMPWWRENPVRLSEAELKQIEVGGPPKSALTFRGCLYEYTDDPGRGLDCAAIMCVAFGRSDDAAHECENIRGTQSGDGPNEALVGLLREQDNALVIVSFPRDCPGRAAFVSHFHKVARGGSDSPVPGTTTRSK
jgi:hypothetical protein